MSPDERVLVPRGGAADERAAVVRVAAEELRGRIFTPRGGNFVDEPSALGEVDPQAWRGRFVADVHVLRSLDHPAVFVVKGDAVLAARHNLKDTRLRCASVAPMSIVARF
jgi:hypothetical protein